MNCKCWVCKRTKEEIVDELYNLNQTGLGNKELTKETMGNSVEFIEYNNDETSCVNIFVCNICNSLYWGAIEESMDQFVTKYELEDFAQSLKVVVE